MNGKEIDEEELHLIQLQQSWCKELLASNIIQPNQFGRMLRIFVLPPLLSSSSLHKGKVYLRSENIFRKIFHWTVSVIPSSILCTLYGSPWTMCANIFWFKTWCGIASKRWNVHSSSEWSSFESEYNAYFAAIYFTAISMDSHAEPAHFDDESYFFSFLKSK